MGNFSRTHGSTSRENIGVNGSNVFVVQSNPIPLLTMVTPYSAKAATPTPRPASSSKPWLESQDLKRRKRIAMYKLYALEGKVKKSFKKGFRWVKRTCNKIVHGF